MKAISTLESVIVCLLMAGSRLTVAATPTPDHADVANLSPPAPGYGVEVLQWNVEIYPGQLEILNGTVEEVYAQVLQINPAYKLSTPVGRRSNLQQRTTVICGNFGLADKGAIQDGINYLRRLPAAPRNGPGPANCGRVSCSYNSAIWWCNDDTSPKTLDSWDWIANSAQYIVGQCGSGADRVSGQNFESNNWNTIVRSDSC